VDAKNAIVDVVDKQHRHINTGKLDANAPIAYDDPTTSTNINVDNIFDEHKNQFKLKPKSTFDIQI
jgi:hypothetical protein